MKIKLKSGIIMLITMMLIPIFVSASEENDESKISIIPIDAEKITGEVLVKFRSGIGDKEISDLTSKHGIKSIEKVLKKYRKNDDNLKANVLEKYGLDRLQILKIPEDVDIDELIREINKDLIVEYAEPNYIVHTDVIPNDPRFSYLWGLHNTGQNGGTADADMDAPEAWNTQTGSSNVVIAVIDSGVYYNHPDLAANIWTNQGEIAGNGKDDDGNGYIDDIRGYDFANNDGNPIDDNGHGTHIAGTIGAVGNDGYGIAGVNWNVKIMPIKFLNSGGSGSTANAIKSIQYATMMGADIMSSSWGGGGYSLAMRDAIAAANEKGILFVAAAGNSGRNSDAYPHYPASYDIPNIISVAATDNKDELASFSNYGATSVDLGAPGVSIYSTVLNNGYASYSGTSMATPHVSGVIGLIKARFPGYASDEIKAQLFNSVDVIPSLNGKTVTGGRLNARKALESATQNNPPVANDLSVTTSENIPVAITLNATDPDGDPLTYSIVFGPSHGSISGTPPGVTYTPSANYNGADSFTFRVNDGMIDSNTATVGITVNPTVSETIEFNDSFENGLVNWTQDSQNDWFVSSQRRTQGRYSAGVDGSATDATLTLKNAINLSGKNATLSFSWFIEGNWDNGEYIKLDIFNGNSWINVASINGTSGTTSGRDENQWINRDINLSAYMVQNFKFRFIAKVSSSLEDGNVDNVKIISGV